METYVRVGRGDACVAPTGHRRRSIRLKGYDYNRAGVYFVTVCVLQRECLFGDVVGVRVQLNDIGHMVEKCWNNISVHFPGVELDEFVVMPNHVHGIVVIDDRDGMVGATHASPLRMPAEGARGPKSQSLGAIVGSFKSAASKQINGMRRTPGMPVWQRNYWEHIVRDDDELGRIRKYIVENPVEWKTDDLNSAP